MRSVTHLAARFLVLLAALSGSATVGAQCAPAVPTGSFEYRFGLAESLQTDEDLLELLENPTSLAVRAADVEGRSASTVSTTETHALYPIAPREMVDVLRDDSVLTKIVPDLTVIETICWNGTEMMKQMQRVEFNVLFFQFGTEYLIDVHVPLNDQNEYGSYWGMYESLDGKLSHQYGSWYFTGVVIDGATYTYVRHFLTNGVVARIPGLGLIMERNAERHVATMLDALYNEALSRQAPHQAALP